MVLPSGLTSSDIQLPTFVLKVSVRVGASGNPSCIGLRGGRRFDRALSACAPAVENAVINATMNAVMQGVVNLFMIALLNALIESMG